VGITGVYIIFHPTTTEYTFFSAAHRTFCKTDHLLEHEHAANFNKYKKMEITNHIFIKSQGITLEKTQNYSNI
jgi:hypothetical protein